MGLKEVTKGYRELQEVIGGYKGLPGVKRVTRGYRGLQELQGLTTSYRGFQRGYSKLQRVTEG